jgi:hypothetical protein
MTHRLLASHTPVISSRRVQLILRLFPGDVSSCWVASNHQRLASRSDWVSPACVCLGPWVTDNQTPASRSGWLSRIAQTMTSRRRGSGRASTAIRWFSWFFSDYGIMPVVVSLPTQVISADETNGYMRRCKSSRAKRRPRVIRTCPRGDRLIVDRGAYRPGYRKSTDNLTPADAYCGRGHTILLQRDKSCCREKGSNAKPSPNAACSINASRITSTRAGASLNLGRSLSQKL